MNKVEVWIGGLISAAIGGAANSILVTFVPGVHIDKDQWVSNLSIAGIGALVAVSNYLKSSPLPIAQEEDKSDR